MSELERCPVCKLASTKISADRRPAPWISRSAKVLAVFCLAATSTVVSQSTSPPAPVAREKLFIPSIAWNERGRYYSFIVSNKSLAFAHVAYRPTRAASDFRLEKRVPNPTTVGAGASVELARFHLARGAKRIPVARPLALMSFADPTAEARDHVYGFPLRPSQRVTVLQGFDSLPTHVLDQQYAVDFGVPENSPVLAARDGVVVDTFDASASQCILKRIRSCGAYANQLQIRHSDGTVAAYGHLRHASILVRVNQQVRRGEVIAYSGSTGTVVPHLHFHVYRFDTRLMLSMSMPFQMMIEGRAHRTFARGQTVFSPARSRADEGNAAQSPRAGLSVTSRR